MVALCQNRPEGFGPQSSLHPQLPTTCFLDVIVEPLATWIFLVLMLALLAMHRPTLHHPGHAQSSLRIRRKPRNRASALHRRNALSRIFSVIYYLLIVAMLAMVSLEIARLIVAQLGIGLLPFTYVGVLVAVANRITWRSRIGRLANFFYWVLLAAAMALKTATEQEEQMSPAIRVKGDGTQGLYPTSDEVVDNAVMVGVEVVLAVLEFAGFGELARW